MDNWKQVEFAIVGAGLGGCSIAALLQSYGYNVKVYEQAENFLKLGAGIHLSPNVVKLLEVLGIDQHLIDKAAKPNAFISRDLLDDGLLFSLPLGDNAHWRYGSPYLTVNRGDFHAALMSKVKKDTIHFGKKLTRLDNLGSQKLLMFEDGTEATANIVIGADGLNSRVRASLRGEEAPSFANQVVFRGRSPISKINYPGRFELTKWWEGSRFLISYFMEKDPEAIYFVAGIPWDEWLYDGASIPASREMLMEYFSDACSPIKELVAETDQVSLWPLYEREPINEWGSENILLLGDACHPMRPHMAQGAAMAIEDAFLFVRLLNSGTYQNLQEILHDYSELRLPRTRLVQSISSVNSWLKKPTDPDWLYGYDVLNSDISLLKTA